MLSEEKTLTPILFRSKSNGLSASEQHKQELADLATVDPEFYKFLKKEDAGLLNFDFDDDEEENIPDDDPEQEIHQLPERLEEMDAPSDEDQVSDGDSDRFGSFTMDILGRRRCSQGRTGTSIDGND